MVPMMLHSRLTPQSQNQARRVWSLTLLSMVLLGAVATPSVEARPQRSPLFTSQLTLQPKPRQVAQTRLPRLVDQRVRREAAQQLGTAPRRLTVVSYSAETWPDKCLGLAAPNERCMGGETKGWRVEITDGQQNKVYRTDAKAQTIKLEVKDQSNLLPEVSDRLLQTVSKQAGVPISTLKITETKPATFDGCMGIYKPGQMCTRIAIAGWQVVVAGEKQSWVYHVSEDATRIAQNTTASGSKGEIFVSFIPAENQAPAPDDPNIVLWQSVSGGIAGITTDTFLTTDGVIYRQTSRMGTPTTAKPEIVKRISTQQVQQLQQVLENQQFPNLRGLRYLTSAALADYPTTTLQAMGSTVEYIDIEKGDLPVALQAVIQSWEGLQP